MALNFRFDMPQASNPIVGSKALAAQNWFNYFWNVYVSCTEGLPQTVTVLPVDASPSIYTATIKGQAHVGGGTVSAIEFSRDGVTWYNIGTTSGFVQMDARDQLRITYTVLPTLSYFPM